jgi:hypothetical protein
MDGNTQQTRACEGVQPSCVGVRIEVNQSNNRMTYWGILCRTCRELTAFDTRPCDSVGPGAPSMRPCAIRCRLGHNHIYFPRDFRLRPSAILIADAVIQKNCEAFMATNPSSPASSSRPTWRAVEPEPRRESDSRPGRVREWWSPHHPSRPRPAQRERSDTYLSFPYCCPVSISHPHPAPR